MTAATIRVKQANPPAAGKKQGKVSTEDGSVFGVWPKMLGLLRPGATYEVEYTESTFGEGQTWRTITKVRHVEVAAQPASQNDNKVVNLPSHRDREFEFVARALPALIQICAVEATPEGMVRTTRMLRQVYRDAFK